MGVEGDLCEGIGLYGTQEAFGQAHSPQTLPGKLGAAFVRFLLKNVRVLLGRRGPNTGAQIGTQEGEAKGAQRGPKRGPKGSKREPKGQQRDPKGTPKAPKGHPKDANGVASAPIGRY